MNHSNIIMYTTEDGLTKIETTFEDDTVWLSIDQMAELFQRDKSTISRHIKNIFEEGELQRISVVAFLPVAVTSAISRHWIRLMPNTPSIKTAWKTPFPRLNRTLSKALVHWKRLRIPARNKLLFGPFF